MEFPPDLDHSSSLEALPRIGGVLRVAAFAQHPTCIVNCQPLVLGHVQRSWILMFAQMERGFGEAPHEASHLAAPLEAVESSSRTTRPHVQASSVGRVYDDDRYWPQGTRLPAPETGIHVNGHGCCYAGPKKN